MKRAPALPPLGLTVVALACTGCGAAPWTTASAITESDASSSGDGATIADAGSESEAADGAVREAAAPHVGDVIVDPSVVYQTMQGFGAADVFSNAALTPAQAQLFFDPTNGIGLSMLRVGIDVNGEGFGAGTIPDVKAAASYGAIVWASPWSPPPGDKDNDSENNGGGLCAASGQGVCTGNDYAAWASALASFPAWLTGQTGVPVYAVSPQNEPDYAASYVSCVYTASEMVNFIDVLGPALASLSPPVKLIAPEPMAWGDLWLGASDCSQANDYGPCIYADPNAMSAVAIFATHDYSFQPIPPPSWVTQPIWETEVSGVEGSAQAGPSVDITNGIAVASWIYQALVTGGASAWHYWWLVSTSGVDNEGLLFPTGEGPDGGDINSPPKRLYTVGNFSKFVRPGYQRIEVSGPLPTGVDIAAFSNPADQTTVIVAINFNTSATPVSLFVSGANWPSQVTPWVTSATSNLVAQSNISLSGARFAVDLAPQSVTTYVGAP